MNFNLTQFTGHYVDVDKLGEKPLILDMGANNGDTVGQLLNIAPNSKIYAYECNAKLCNEFREKYQNNKNVVLVEKAIADKNGVINFHNYDNYPFHGNITNLTYKEYFIPDKPATFEVYPVEMIGINDVLNDFKEIDYLKMDVSGSEKMIFDVISNENLIKIKQMSIELINGVHEMWFIQKLLSAFYVIAGIGDLYAVRKI